MSRKTTPRETEKPKKLTRAQKKKIDAVIRKYKGDGKPRTAQATILSAPSCSAPWLYPMNTKP